jgi:hypothetical protein
MQEMKMLKALGNLANWCLLSGNKGSGKEQEDIEYPH